MNRDVKAIAFLAETPQLDPDALCGAVFPRLMATEMASGPVSR
jgi:hypothetical protein